MERQATSASDLEPAQPKLSICISTLNRANFLRETLEAILPQLTAECEVVVVDNASVDSTASVGAEMMRRSDRVRYIRKETNNGMDRNFDRAVELSGGEYAWLMPDDDLLKPGAVAAVLEALHQQPSLVLVNYEFRDLSLSKVLQERVLDFDSDRTYGAWELDRLFVELRDFIRYIGAVVISRAVWLSRQRELYIGSYYDFVGMIFQERLPRSVYVIAQPCVSFRSGNEGTYASKIMEIVLAKWPSLVASLPLADSSKRKLHSAQPWRHFYELLFWRGSGFYSYDQYRRWIRPQLDSATEKFIPVVSALVPCALANLMLTLYLCAHRGKLYQMQGLQLNVLRASPFHFRHWQRRGPQRRAIQDQSEGTRETA
jgi:abequosyltransferase